MTAITTTEAPAQQATEAAVRATQKTWPHMKVEEFIHAAVAGEAAQQDELTALIQQPATVDEMHDIGNGIMYGQVVDATIDDKEIDKTPAQAPSAIKLANTLAFEYGIEPALAIRWLAERADEFKTMNTITEVTP